MMKEYFLTYGRGLETIVLNELQSLVDKDDELQIEPYEIEGKIVFRTNLSVSRLLALRTVERLFISLVFRKFDSNDSFDQTRIIQYIEETLEFDFKSYVPFESEFDSNEDESRSKRLCKGFKFRVDCRMTGKWKKLSEFKQQLIDKVSEKVTRSNNQMEVDIKSPDFWVTCHVSDACLAIGLALTKEPLSSRPYLKHVGLRATICSAMLNLTEIKQSNSLLVIDPFCGRSTIAAEMMSSISNHNSFWLCSDASDEQLVKSRENLSDSERCDLLRVNLSRESMFPYKSGVADVIITDLPFGKNHSIEYFCDNQQKSKINVSALFYAKILVEFERILANSGAIIVLVNSNEVGMFKQCLNDDGTINLVIVSTNLVSLGETSAAIIKLKKR